MNHLIASAYRLAGYSVLFGAALLLAVTIMIVVSVSGRALISIGLGPVPGDFELVEVGTAIAVFFFLPWTYLKGGHATVDLLYMHLPQWGKKAIVMVSDLLMLAVWLIMTWKLYEGMLEKKEYLETTFILAMPIWWAYAACLVGAVIGCLAYIARTLTLFGIGKEPAGWTTEAGVH
jgi:TRAP-type C4-dicarboxylate transport system permease small subunit